MRNQLRSIIVRAWSASIEEDYRRQRINSERSLQASFWAKLHDEIGPRRRMFIEPGITYSDKGVVRRIFPDIVICNTREIVAVIELKFHPKVRPPFTKDLASLNNMSKHRKSISLRNSRFNGIEFDPKTYTGSAQILFAWAGIHKGCYEEQDWAAWRYPHLKGCYLELHAETKRSSDPEIYSYRA